jgi:hypothetical protein
MIEVCAGYFRPRFFSLETIIPRESKNHALRRVSIPHTGSSLRKGFKKDLTPNREAAKKKKRERRTSGDQAG